MKQKFLIEYFIKLNPKVINFILICDRPHGNKNLINKSGLWIFRVNNCFRKILFKIINYFDTAQDMNKHGNNFIF